MFILAAHYSTQLYYTIPHHIVSYNHAMPLTSFDCSSVRSLRRGVETASVTGEERKLLFGPRVNGPDDGGESRTKNQANPAQVSSIITYEANTIGLIRRKCCLY